MPALRSRKSAAVSVNGWRAPAPAAGAPFEGRAPIPAPANEPVLSYAPGTPERAAVKAALAELRSEAPELPLVIGGREVRTGRLGDCRAPHEHALVFGRYHLGGPRELDRAADAALAARADWAARPFQERAAVFLKAAELLSGPRRARVTAASMLDQSKTVHQAEIDAVCELADFWRFNALYAEQLHAVQPSSPKGVWNFMDYRPLEGFVLAVTPFNFASIAGNLPSAPALMGNVAVWKPSESTVFVAHAILDVLVEAGLPPGVINLVTGPAGPIVERALARPELAGLHYTGSTEVFQRLWTAIGDRVASYRSYPRIVGETGGKDFVVAHASADPDALATALLRGAFEYQGQKCSAASRAYVPRSLWPKVKDRLLSELSTVRMGAPEDFRNFMTAVINEPAYRRIMGYVARARRGAAVLHGGAGDASEGWFIEPTVLETEDPRSLTMREEIFGPVLTVHPYADARWEETLRLCDSTSPYALTGAVFARDRAALRRAAGVLRDAAGNFYLNDKPTGAVVGQQPFGGARASGTNDKAGSVLNLLRWTSPRAVKETFDPPADYRYPFMEAA